MDGPLVCQLGGRPPSLGSHVRSGEALKASKREAHSKMSAPTGFNRVRPREDHPLDRRHVEVRQRAQQSRTNGRGLDLLFGLGSVMVSGGQDT